MTGSPLGRTDLPHRISAPSQRTVTVSAFGKWHAFQLARQMQRLGVLRRLYTAHPTGPDLPPGKISNWLGLAFIHAGLQRVGLSESAQLGGLFDHWVAERLRRERPGGASILHAWAGYCLQSLLAARSLGWLAYVERSSVHMELQRQLVWEECDRWGISHSRIPFPLYGGMLKEYEAADRIVVPSEFVARSFFERGFPTERILTVPLGVDTHLFRPPAQPRPPRPFRLLTVATEPIRKGLGDLLQAWGRLRLPDSELWVVPQPVFESHSVLFSRLSKSSSR